MRRTKETSKLVIELAIAIDELAKALLAEDHNNEIWHKMFEIKQIYNEKIFIPYTNIKNISYKDCK